MASLEALFAQHMAAMGARFAQMDARFGQMLNKLPSWWQMPAVIGATVALVVLLYSVVQYLHAAGRL